MVNQSKYVSSDFPEATYQVAFESLLLVTELSRVNSRIIKVNIDFQVNIVLSI